MPRWYEGFPSLSGVCRAFNNVQVGVELSVSSGFLEVLAASMKCCEWMLRKCFNIWQLMYNMRTPNYSECWLQAGSI